MLRYIFAAGLTAIAADAALAHDWYAGLKNPAGESCCGAYDCAEATVYHDGGGYVVEFEGLRLPVRDDRIIRDRSPDGKPHACVVQGYGGFYGSAPTGPWVRCLIFPPLS